MYEVLMIETIVSIILSTRFSIHLLNCIVYSSFPGQSKMVINHIEKLFVTNDAATILRELEVQHPAAKMIVMACQQQEQEVGDGTNFVMIFAGALLESAEMLIRMVRNFLFYPINVQWSIMKFFYIEVLLKMLLCAITAIQYSLVTNNFSYYE